MGCGSSSAEGTIINQTTSPKKSIASQLNDVQLEQPQQNQQSNQNVENLTKSHLIPNKNQEEEHSIIEDIKFDNEDQNGIVSARVSKEKLKSAVFYTYPKIETAKIYLFGESEEERKIVSFSIEQSKFEIVSSRSHNFQSAKSKYQPSDTIFESSQQLMASHLYNKFSKPPYNFMFATYITDDKIFMCGGVNGSFDYISDESFIYKIKNQMQKSHFAPVQKGNNLLGIKFEKLEPMHKQRYSHMGVYFILNGLGYIYVFGGRGQGEEILNHCQRYSLEEKKWMQISPMKVQRSTGFSLIFGNKIYVFGGYTSEQKRTKKIEVYDPQKDYWEVLDVKLHRGLEAGFIVSSKPNEILIMGGNVQLGALKSVIKVNLAQKTYNWDSNMKNQRFLQKGAMSGKEVYIFGGDFQDTFEKYSFKDRKWREQKIQYKQFIRPQDINSFTLATETLNVQFDESSLSTNTALANNEGQSTTDITNNKSTVMEFQKIHIFGTDEYPIIFEINIVKWVLKKKSVPMSLRLRCHMGVTKIKQGKYLVAGGIDTFGQKCSRAAYLYYSGTNNALEIDKLSCKKYDFVICSVNEVVYLFGGKTQKNGDILNVCEKYDTKKQDTKWQKLPNLTRERAGAKCLKLSNKILLWGGVDSIMSVTEIQIFDTLTESFSVYQRTIPMSSDIVGVALPQSSIDSKASNQQIFIFSYNDLLKQQYCHTCQLNIQQQSKGKDSVSSQDLDLKEVDLKITPFNFVFSQKETFYFITDKGVMNWQPSKQALQEGESEKMSEKDSMKPQIIINQVEMLQYPIKEFSFPY